MLSDIAISYAHTVIEGRIEVARDIGDADTVAVLERQFDELTRPHPRLSAAEIADLIEQLDSTFDADEIADVRREFETLRGSSS